MNVADRAWLEAPDGHPLTLAYERSWQRLCAYLHERWHEITARGSFDLSKPYPGEVASQSLYVHLYFVKVLGRRLLEEGIDVNLDSFVTSLRDGTAHPEVTLLVADSRVPAGRLQSYHSDVSVLRSGEEVLSALWMHWVPPVAIKICHVKTGAPVREPPGFPWHPNRQRKIVKLSPYKGDTQPTVARRDLRI